jgi:hypothetical protein
LLDGGGFPLPVPEVDNDTHNDTPSENAQSAPTRRRSLGGGGGRDKWRIGAGARGVPIYKRPAN